MWYALQEEEEERKTRGCSRVPEKYLKISKGVVRTSHIVVDPALPQFFGHITSFICPLQKRVDVVTCF